jgi:acyl-CoA reductase-like NAD-dependent aldehyde dehydrogenase
MFIGMQYISGEFTATRPDFSSYNPATEEELGVFPTATALEIHEAVEVAYKVLSAWQSLTKYQRCKGLWFLKDIIQGRIVEIAQAISLETGKHLNESLNEVQESLRIIHDISSQESSFRKSKGVVAVITPWNFPFVIALRWIVSALSQGNTVVFKPSEKTPMVGQIITDLMNSINLPPGVFNLLHGKIGNSLILHNKINHICFTGKTQNALSIRHACNKSFSFDTSAKSAIIVFDDADIDLALQICQEGAFKLTGQSCRSIGRILVHWKVFYEFAHKFTELSSKIKVGNPNKDIADVGPLISAKHLQKVMEYNKMTTGLDNVHIFLQGRKLDGKGHFLTPHIYSSDWNNKCAFLRDEVLGPHVAIIPFNDIDESIEIFNDTCFISSLGVMTSDYQKAKRCRDRCVFDSGSWNGYEDTHIISKDITNEALWNQN